MWVLTYDGRREDSSFRHPEQLIQPAPPYLQKACRRFGGENHRGQPNFRLVLVSSRYRIAGGHDFTFLDTHGNYQKTCPAEMLIPRYPAERWEWGLYLLERWQSPEWFYRNGFGQARDVEWGPQGKAIRCMEPVWPEGGYEACWWDVNQLFVLPRTVTAEGTHPRSLSIQQAIWAVRRRAEVTPKMVSTDITETRKAEKERDIQEGAELIIESGHSDMFLEPTVSMAGAYKEGPWEKKESSALEPAIA
jgi:hypothetical protein